MKLNGRATDNLRVQAEPRRRRWIDRAVYCSAILFFAGVFAALWWLFEAFTWRIAFAAACGAWIGTGATFCLVAVLRATDE